MSTNIDNYNVLLGGTGFVVAVFTGLVAVRIRHG